MRTKNEIPKYHVNSRKVDGKAYRIVNCKVEPEASWQEVARLHSGSWAADGRYFCLSTAFDGRRYEFVLPRAMAEALKNQLERQLKDTEERFKAEYETD
jgi:hypothetical protein